MIKNLNYQFNYQNTQNSHQRYRHKTSKSTNDAALMEKIMTAQQFQRRRNQPTSTSSSISPSPSPQRHQRSQSQEQSPVMGVSPFDSLMPEDSETVRLPIFNKLFSNGLNNDEK